MCVFAALKRLYYLSHRPDSQLDSWKHLIWRLPMLSYAPEDWYTRSTPQRDIPPPKPDSYFWQRSGKKNQANALNLALTSPAVCFDKQTLGNLLWLSWGGILLSDPQNKTQSRSAHLLGSHACPPPDTDRKNLLNRSRCSPVVQINAGLTFLTT